MRITITQEGKSYKIHEDNTVTVTHEHDAIEQVSGGYFRNKYTGEWISEIEARDAQDVRLLEEEYKNKYY